uniref:Elicitin n=1 Tax=Globisporangium ultimum (strain ATCC 200006 / CBS 805.95 / DAOM BR144) TaxID=431595 RepID=K3WW73_GLOUD
MASTASAADKCSLPNLVVVLQPITAGVYDCFDITQHAVIPPRVNPTPDVVTAVCTKCSAMMEQSKSITYPDCYWTIEGVNVPFPEHMSKWWARCAAISSPAPTPSSTPSAPTTAPTTSAPAPSSTTTTPSATTMTPSATTMTPSATTATPSVTTATPTTPAPTKVSC